MGTGACGTAGGCGGGGGLESVLYASMSIAQTTNIAVGDHVKFETVDASRGSAITLQTAAYPALGRFTLAAGALYELWATMPRATWSGLPGNLLLQWFRLDTVAAVGKAGILQPDTTTADTAGVLTCRTAIDLSAAPGAVDVEWRLTAATALSSLGGGSDMLGQATILQLGV